MVVAEEDVGGEVEVVHRLLRQVNKTSPRKLFKLRRPRNRQGQMEAHLAKHKLVVALEEQETPGGAGATPDREQRLVPIEPLEANSPQSHSMRKEIKAQTLLSMWAPQTLCRASLSMKSKIPLENL